MNILIASGGSVHSEAALQFGAHLARHTGGTLALVTVIKSVVEQPRAERIRAWAETVLGSDVGPIQTRIRIGHPAEEIIREVEAGGYELLIVGEREQHRLITRFLLGSTAVRVVEHAPCPVIVAKGRIGPLRRVLLCDSGVAHPALLERFQAQLAGLLRGDEAVTILHVMSQMGTGPNSRAQELTADAEALIAAHALEGEFLTRDLRILQRFHLQPAPKVRHGLVVDEILAEVKVGDYDLVVIGAHRGQGWRRILLDDLAHQIVARIDRPILVVR